MIDLMLVRLLLLLDVGVDRVVGSRAVPVNTSGGVLPRDGSVGAGRAGDKTDLDTGHRRLDASSAGDPTGNSGDAGAQVGSLSGSGGLLVGKTKAKGDGGDLGAVLGARGEDEAVLLVDCTSASERC